MDKRSVLGFVLIGIVLMIWLYWNSSNQQKTVQNIKLKNDSVNVTERKLPILSKVILWLFNTETYLENLQ